MNAKQTMEVKNVIKKTLKKHYIRPSPFTIVIIIMRWEHTFPAAFSSLQKSQFLSLLQLLLSHYCLPQITAILFFWAFAEFFYLLVVLKLQCVWPPRGSHLKGSLNVLVRVKLTWIINKILNERLYFGKMFEALVAQMPKCTETVRCPNSVFLFCLSFVSCVQLFNKTERTFGAHADPLQLSKYAYTFYVCATFVLTFHVQSRPLYPCRAVTRSFPVHLCTYTLVHTRIQFMQ